MRRDFAFFVPAALPADQLLRAVRGADKEAITEVSLFDLFTGKGVPGGQKSLAIEVVMQPREKSFTEPELAVSTHPRMERRVVLPLPEGPTSSRTSPELAVMLTDFRAWKARAPLP